MTGKSTDPTGKKKSKEPDIAVALFAGLKEITIYEPNLYRVEMEDYKGLEVVLLLVQLLYGICTSATLKKRSTSRTLERGKTVEAF